MMEEQERVFPRDKTSYDYEYKMKRVLISKNTNVFVLDGSCLLRLRSKISLTFFEIALAFFPTARQTNSNFVQILRTCHVRSFSERFPTHDIVCPYPQNENSKRQQQQRK